MDLSRYKAVEPCRLSKKSIENVAERVAGHFGYKADLGGDFNRKDGDIKKFTVEKLGGKIVSKDFWTSRDDGSIIIESVNEFTIFVPEDALWTRERFTIAHELGHYFLHFIWPVLVNSVAATPTAARRYGSDTAEREANWFAASFLMPKKPFLKALKKRKNDVGAVAEQFGVSRQAAEIRANTLAS